MADVLIVPTSVSFSYIETQEQEVRAKATGYYDIVLGWNGALHPLGKWVPIDAANNGIIDRVGTRPPGTAGPFSNGKFIWPIDQHYQTIGAGGTGHKYSVGTHIQDMKDATGEETTAKEGAVGGPRTP